MGSLENLFRLMVEPTYQPGHVEKLELKPTPDSDPFYLGIGIIAPGVASLQFYDKSSTSVEDRCKIPAGFSMEFEGTNTKGKFQIRPWKQTFCIMMHVDSFLVYKGEHVLKLGPNYFR